MKKLYILFLIFFAVNTMYADEITISFQSKDNAVSIDSIHATNLTKGQTVKLSSGESLIIASATSSDLIKISDIGEGYLYPNPSSGYTTLSLNTAQNEKVYISIYDMAGKMLLSKTHSLNQGVHKFHLRFPTPGLYHVNVLTNGGQLNYKAVYIGRDQQVSEIEYLGSDQLTAVNARLKSAHTEKSLDYSEGDVIHYVVFSGDNITVISDTPTASKTIEVEFYECKDPNNRNYKIVQIGNQWWMAKNLAYLPAVSGSSSGSYTAKHYYVHEYNGTDVNAAKATNNYSTYGVLYNWPAALSACPGGWHLPSDDEWLKLENYLAYNGYNYDGTIGEGRNKIAKSMAATTLWDTSPNAGAVGNNLSVNNSSGFSALPGGSRYDGDFEVIGSSGIWWSSTENSSTNAWFRGMPYNYGNVYRNNLNKGFGFSVRCVRDSFEEVITLTLSVSPSGAGEVTGTGNYHEGEEVEINANAHDGYEFVNWTGDTEYISNVDAAITTVTMPGSNISLTANFDDDSGNGNGLTGEPCPGMPTFTDERDGNVYNTVLIGDQCWLKENLKYLPEVYPSGSGSHIQARYYVNGYQGTDISEAVNTDNYKNYGVLYNWPAAMNGAGSSSANPSGVQGACPAGWHLPSDLEWAQLVDYVVSQGYPNQYGNPNGAGNALKSCRQVYSPLGGECVTSEHPRWNFNSTHYGTDQFGFSALPGGLRYSTGNFYYICLSGYWWSSTEHSSTFAWSRTMHYDYGHVGRSSGDYLGNEGGFSVRCVRD